MPIAKITHDGFKAELAVTRDGVTTLLDVSFDGDDRITELRDMLFRAANTLDPHDTPAWVTDLLDVLDGVPR